MAVTQLENKLPSIEDGPTALAWPMTMTFNPLPATVMTYSQGKVQGQWSVSSEDKSGNKQTYGQMDGGDDCMTSLANAVANKFLNLQTEDQNVH